MYNFWKSFLFLLLLPIYMQSDISQGEMENQEEQGVNGSNQDLIIASLPGFIPPANLNYENSDGEGDS